MNAFVRKEVRLLLPNFLVALLLSFSVWLMPNHTNSQDSWRTFLTIFPFLLCPAMVVMLALDSFGREISGGTLTHLLAQPIPRHSIWWTKVLLLAGALLIVLTVWAVSFRFHFWNQMAVPERSAWKDTMLLAPALFALVAFSGGLWSVLLLRQVAAAFWFTLIVPSAILLLVMKVTDWDPALFRSTLIGALIFYSVAGFFFARRLFLQAQDLKPSSGEIALPRWRAWNWRLASVDDRRRWRPRAALWRKEFQLHQSQFVLAGVLLLLHLVVIAARRVVDANSSPALDFVLLTFWVLWLFMPLLVGCTAVAEERKLGTLEGQLCLPATRRRQFIIKFVSTLMLSVLFGALMPLLLERGLISPDVPPLQLAGLAALIGAMAFYASTLARNTLQSLAPGMLGVLLVMMILNVAAHRQNLFGVALWPWPLVYLIGAPAFAIAFVGLMYWNFKRVLVGGMVWRRNAQVLLITLIGVTTVTATLYHRVWELLTAIEPPHGPAVAALDERTTMRLEGWRPLVELSDGRVWFVRMGQWDENGMRSAINGGLRGAFLEGTNWAKIIATARDLLGVQKDGSLWIAEESENSPGMSPKRSTGHIRMTRVGADNDWTNAAVYQNLSVLLLKTDGTLWEFGPQPRPKNRAPTGLHAFTPERLGAESDWISLSTDNRRIFLGQRDGRFWVWPKYSHVDTNTLTLRPGLILHRAPDLDPSDPPSLWVHWDRGTAQIGVLPDGTLRVTGGPQFRPRRAGEKLDPQGYYAPLGKEHDWRAVAGFHNQTPVTLKADGTIWKWEFPGDLITNPGSAAATKLSTHSDWVAISEGWSGVFTLARDGSLWLWRFENPYRSPNDYFLLRVSRRPQRLGNIFGTKEQ
jgi:ABC-type transport system involved in multi-copper enzyme maturation permease subunit